MSSTQQLEIGKKLSLRQLIGTWIKTHNERGPKVHVYYNVKRLVARYKSVCSSAPKTKWQEAVDAGCCKAHVTAVGRAQD